MKKTLTENIQCFVEEVNKIEGFHCPECHNETLQTTIKSVDYKNNVFV